MEKMAKRKIIFNGWTDARDGHPFEWKYNNAVHMPPINDRKTDVGKPGYKLKITIEWEEKP